MCFHGTGSVYCRWESRPGDEGLEESPRAVSTRELVRACSCWISRSTRSLSGHEVNHGISLDAGTSFSVFWSRSMNTRDGSMSLLLLYICRLERMTEPVSLRTASQHIEWFLQGSILLVQSVCVISFDQSLPIKMNFNGNKSYIWYIIINSNL